VKQHRPARVLVTGGAGFIGSHLVARLVARGDEVTVLDDLRTSSVDNLAEVAEQITFVQGDCAHVAELLDGCDLVFHLAAPAYVPPSVEDPISDLRANVEQTLLLLNALRRLERAPRLIHVSSAAIYGSPAVQPIREDLPPAPVSPYGVDKFAAEEHVRVASKIHGIRAAILRYFSVYGPRQTKQVVYDLIQKVNADPARIQVHGTGHELRDLVYVSDVVEATLIAADRAPGHGEAYNVGSGSYVSIADVVAAVCRAMGAQPQIAWTGSVRPGDPDRIVADISRLTQLGYEPAVAFTDGIERTVAWAGAPATDRGAVA
jgi:UDP-glucose 4-epimerase